MLTSENLWKIKNETTAQDLTQDPQLIMSTSLDVLHHRWHNSNRSPNSKALS